MKVLPKLLILLSKNTTLDFSKLTSYIKQNIGLYNEILLVANKNSSSYDKIESLLKSDLQEFTTIKLLDNWCIDTTSESIYIINDNLLKNNATLSEIPTEKNTEGFDITLVCAGKEKNEPFFKKLLRNAFAFILRIITPINFKKIDICNMYMSNASLYRGMKIKNISSVFEILTYGVLRNQKVNILSLPLINKSTAGLYITSILQTLKTAISCRIEWFLTEPFKKNPLIGAQTDGIYRFLVASIFIVLLFLMPLLSLSFGITWDEYLHNGYAKDLLNYYTSFGKDQSIYDTKKHAYSTMISYGASFDLYACMLQKIFSSAGEYEIRHILNSLFGLVTLIYGTLIARQLLGWRAGFIALLLLLFSPSFMGHTMNNPKDIPFAAGYVMSIYFLLKLLKELPSVSAKTGFFLTFSIALSISIRPGGFLLIAYAFLALFIALIIYLKQHKLKNIFKSLVSFLKPVLLICVVGYFAGLIFWPFALKNPFKNPLIALKEMTNLQGLTLYELFDGGRYYTDKPWYYIPKYILITAPIAVLIGILPGLLLLLDKKKTINRLKVLALLFVIVFPVSYAIYQKSFVYNGWRHFLFVYPPLVAFTAVGWEYILRLIKQKYVQLAIAGVLSILLLKPAIWSIKNHPLEYLYYNEFVGGLHGAYGNYETDYWCQSPRIATEWLLANKPEIKNKKTVVATNNEVHSLSYYFQKETDSVNVAWTRENEWNKKNWDYAIWTTRTLSKEQLRNGAFPPKGTIHVIEADGVPLAAIVKRENSFIPDGYKFMDKNNFAAAAAEFKKATEYDPKNEEAFRLYGWALFYLNQFDESIKSSLKAAEIRPDNSFAYGFIGAAYMRKKDYSKATDYLKAAIKYKWNNSMAYECLGDISFESQKFDDAIKNYNDNLRHGGENPVIYSKIGKSYVGKYSSDPSRGKNNLENALRYFEASVKLDPNMAESYYTMSIIYDQFGNKQLAANYMNKAKSLMGK
ncbi:MAG: tetratricopeptide repeat protein [Bacteroidetes bacterium]|nr:tetratricopeptide repeat protein [Bacteroidota bacterium]